jgi:hypothetical protein
MPSASGVPAIGLWMAKFKEIYPEVEYYEAIDEIPTAEYIEHLYREKLNKSVKPRMKIEGDGDHRVDRHKIASLYELVIAFAAPILPDVGTPDGIANPLNAEFAYFVAQFIIEAFNKKKGLNIDFHISDELDREHVSLLSISTVSDGMIFSNSACWYLIEKYCLDRRVHPENTDA